MIMEYVRNIKNEKKNSLTSKKRLKKWLRGFVALSIIYKTIGKNGKNDKIIGLEVFEKLPF